MSIESIADETVDLRKARRQRVTARPTVDRLPPHSPEAEQGVLGCCLLAPKETLGECIEKIGDRNADAFYDLRHQTIFTAMVEMFDKAEEIDIITIQQNLKNKQMLEQCGGIAYLSQLQDSVPSAANLSYYLDIVHEKHLLRKMISVCTELVGRVYDYEGEVDQLLDEVERDVMAIRPIENSHVDIRGLTLSAIDKIEKRAMSGGKIQGLSTGIPDLDRLTDGLHPAEYITIAALPSRGKAQPLNSKILTPEGFSTMGEMKVGDFVIGLDGKPKKVLGVFPQGIKQLYEVVLTDGSKTKCCKEHLWLTQTKNERTRKRGFTVKTLGQISETIKRSDGGINHALPTYSAVEYKKETQPLPMSPWLLGALIGDGKLGDKNICFFKPEQDVQQKVIDGLPPQDTASEIYGGLRIKRKIRSCQQSETWKILHELGLRVGSLKKFIPKCYLHSSIGERLQLLRGLIDTDGSVDGGKIEFSTSSERLAKDFVTLCRGLGIRTTTTSRLPKYSYKGKKLCGARSWRIWIPSNPNFASSIKHTAKIKSVSHRFHRSVYSITPCGEELCQCIQVEGEIYLTDDFIPTHNTALGVNIVVHNALNGIPGAILSAEMLPVQLVVRSICSEARVNYKHVCEEDIVKMTFAARKISAAPLYIERASGFTIGQVRAVARRLKQQHGIKILLIDFLQLLSGSGDTKEQEVSSISKGIKALGMELEIPILLLSQLNKEGGTKYAAAVTEDTDGLWKLENNGDWQSKIQPLTLNVEKCRDGETGSIDLTFFKEFTRIEQASRFSESDIPKTKSC